MKRDSSDPAVAPSAHPANASPSADGPQADPHKRRAPDAAAFYLERAVAAIDAQFGEGYAATQPHLVAAMVQACAIECAVNTGREAAREMRDAVISLKPRLF